MKNLLIGMPHQGEIDPECQVCLFNATLYLQRKGHNCDPRYAEGTYLSSQRNNLSWQALTRGQDLFFLDSDMIFTPGDMEKIIESGKDVIGGLYYARRPPFFPLAFRPYEAHETANPSLIPSEHHPDDVYWVGMKYHQIAQEVFTHPNGLAVGTGFLYIKNHVLGKMWSDVVVKEHGRPFNMMQMKNGDELKEDLAFCTRAKKLGIEIWCDPNVDLVHLGRYKVDKNTHLDYVGRNEFFYSNDIQGWMNFNELNWLYQKSKKMESIVEIGSWKGRSTHGLLSGCPGTVIAVDHFQGSPMELDRAHVEAKTGNIKEQFLNNCSKFNNLRLIEGTSEDAAKEIPDKSVDMVFIDSAHDYEAVKKDLLVWKDKPVKLLCGHDYSFDSVYKAVSEVIGDIRQYETIWYKELI